MFFFDLTDDLEFDSEWTIFNPDIAIIQINILKKSDAGQIKTVTFRVLKTLMWMMNNKHQIPYHLSLIFVQVMPKYIKLAP